MTELHDDTIQSKIDESKVLLIDFWAQWCGPCRAMNPILADLADKYEESLQISKVNADLNPESMIKYQVTSLPTFLIFKDGVEVHRFSGATPKAKFIAILEKFI